MTKVIVLSVDSLFEKDLEFVKNLPNFKSILENCSVVKNINCVYPTLTYPCHTSMVTGVYPKKHGIYHNEKFDPNKENKDWYWYSKDIKAKTIIDVAKENNLTTSSVLWPVMGANPNIDYNIAEIWAPSREDDPRETFERSSSKVIMDGIYNRHCHYIDWKLEPNMDLFGVNCSVDIIKEYKPDLMLIHLATLDHTRHNYGLFNDEVDKALKMNDKWLGDIIQATKDAGTYKDTNFIILGDHGHLRVDKVINPNVLLKSNGFIKVENGEVKDFDAYVNSSGISAQIIVNNLDRLTELRELLEEFKEELFIENIFTKEEASNLGLEGDFEMVIEGLEGISFGNDFEGSIIKDSDIKDYKFAVATHGHLPTKGNRPPFIAFGPNIKGGVVIEEGDLRAHAATILKMFNLKLDGVEKEAFDFIM
ncbi:TPA: alkaline phosphatase family protein [Clostridioides difficile]|nr:alkaline phosphatase family protein [Clostridioides difficile]